LEAEPWFLVRTIAEFLKIHASTVFLHPTTSLSMKIRHFKWVPHFLGDDLRAKRLDGAQQLLDVLQAQKRCHFRDLIPGDETWVYLDVKPGAIWLPADAELPVRVKRTIASEKVCWPFPGEFTGSHTIAGSHTTLNPPFLCEEVPSLLAQKMQPNSRKICKPLTLTHMDNARVHTVRATQKKLDVSRFKGTPQPPYNPDIAPSDFFQSAENPI
jgi:histone-lysine N-methyltransferase SETMAR